MTWGWAGDEVVSFYFFSEKYWGCIGPSQPSQLHRRWTKELQHVGVQWNKVFKRAASTIFRKREISDSVRNSIRKMKPLHNW